MTGEKTTATLHFFEGGIFIECEDLDIGRFIKQGDGNALLEAVNEIDCLTDPNATFSLTEKGLEEYNRLHNEKQL